MYCRRAGAGGVISGVGELVSLNARFIKLYRCRYRKVCETDSLLGTSLDDLRGFPADARQQAGYQLYRVQRELNPDDWRPMRSIGAGVREIRVREHSGAFRVIYVATFADAIYVLHAFQKKTRQTAKRDMELATSRLREQMARRR